jgi:hypothetical protein
MINAALVKQRADISRTMQHAFNLDLVSLKTVENQISTIRKHSQPLGAIVS